MPPPADGGGGWWGGSEPPPGARRGAPPPRARFKGGADMPRAKLFVGSALRAAHAERVWVLGEVAAAQITLASALMSHDAAAARTHALAALASGQHQPKAHEVTTLAHIACQDFAAARTQVASGLRCAPTHPGMLRAFARALKGEGHDHEAVLVATYARDVATQGAARVPRNIRDEFFEIRQEQLGI